MMPNATAALAKARADSERIPEIQSRRFAEFIMVLPGLNRQQS
jgi:hypothetical protein